jgi:hypothetical protein
MNTIDIITLTLLLYLFIRKKIILILGFSILLIYYFFINIEGAQQKKVTVKQALANNVKLNSTNQSKPDIKKEQKALETAKKVLDKETMEYNAATKAYQLAQEALAKKQV